MGLIDKELFRDELFRHYELLKVNDYEVWAVVDVDEVLDNIEEVKAIPIEQLLSILPKYDNYIHTITYPHNETMEDIYSKGHEEGWNACLKAIKEELDYWEKENGKE